ncbi:response regulator [Gracilibacillus oryzae]|nr:response regulator [Gracilibacillus oryzae]
MIKVVICDDEVIVLDAVQSLIDWNRWGLTLVGTATNGITALELIKKQQPDLVLTDIRMPGLDGFALLEKLNEIESSSYYIIMSGFDEIDYYKKAIQLDVIDYLEKPISIERLEGCLDKAWKKIQTENEIKDLKQKWQDSQSLITEKKMIDLLNQTKLTEQQWNDVAGIKAAEITAVTVGVFRSNSFVEVKKIIRSFRSILDMEIFLVNDGETSVIIWLQYGDSDQLTDFLTALADLNTVIGIGSTYRNPLKIRRTYVEAHEAFKMGEFLEKGGVTAFAELNFSHKISDTLTTLEQNIIFSIRSADSERIDALLEDYLKDIKQNNVSPDVVKQECLKLIFLGLEVMKETGIEYRWKKENFVPYVELENFHSLEAIEKWLKYHFKEMLNWLKELRSKQKHISVQKACTYIDKNYSNDISLEKVASIVKMNPSYFSILFKEEVGLSYIKYITKIRIDKAKLKLKEGKSIAEVSEEVGYLNHRYFSELFKKMTGLTPGQFKKQQKSIF